MQSKLSHCCHPSTCLDVTGLLHTIIFNRALSYVKPLDTDSELFDITYVRANSRCVAANLCIAQLHVAPARTAADKNVRYAAMTLSWRH